MKLNKEDFNWYGLDHEKVKAAYKCSEYVGTFCVKGSYKPYAVYYAPNPDRSLGHKNYVMLYKDPVLLQMFVTGMDEEDIKTDRYQLGMYCEACNEVIYSIMRHDYRQCKCQEVMVDGGKDYTRSSAKGLSVNIDLFTGEAKLLTPSVE